MAQKDIIFLPYFKDSSVKCGFTSKGIKSENIKEVFNLFENLLPNPVKFAWLRQEHLPKVIEVSRQGQYYGDGLVSKRKNLLLIVKTADCIPLYFYNKKKQIVGIIHLSWRTAEKGILEQIPWDYLSSAEIIIGVGLRSCCFKVGKEFLKFNRLAKFLIKVGNDYYYDPVKYIKQFFASCQGKIYDLGICSFCSTKKFPSYRRDNTENRTFSFIGLF